MTKWQNKDCQSCQTEDSGLLTKWACRDHRDANQEMRLCLTTLLSMASGKVVMTSCLHFLISHKKLKEYYPQLSQE